jgi:hypothetical protein
MHTHQAQPAGHDLLLQWINCYISSSPHTQQKSSLPALPHDKGAFKAHMEFNLDKNDWPKYGIA